MAIQQQQNPYTDRITEMLQKRAQPTLTPSDVMMARQASMFTGGQGLPALLQSIQAPRLAEQQAQQQNLQSSQQLYDMFEQQRMQGSKEAQNVSDALAMITSDPQGQAAILSALHEDPEELDPYNRAQLLRKAAGYAKDLGIETDYARQKRMSDLEQQRAELGLKSTQLDIQRKQRDLSAPAAPKLPPGVEIPEGMIPQFENGQFVGVAPMPGIERLSPQITEETIKGEGNLRKEFSGITKDFRDIRQAYNRILSTAEKPSPAGDLSLIFNYMKMLDPGSVVRESEFATAATAKPLLERLGVSWDTVGAVWEGKRLNPGQRKDFLDTAKRLFSGQSQIYNDTARRYRDISEQYGFDPNRIAEIQGRIRVSNPETGEVYDIDASDLDAAKAEGFIEQ